MSVPDIADNRLWLAWTGMETDLIFNKAWDLPGFAAFPMLRSEEGRQRLRDYYLDLIAIGRAFGAGIMIDTPTWMASPDRAAAINWPTEDLDRINAEAVAFAMEHAADDVCISAQLGPRGDGYEKGMASVQAARDYHARQIDIAARSGAELLTAYTIGSTEEAQGIILAAGAAGIPVVVSFVVETDGCLADGMPLREAIERADQATSGAARFFMVNCAHPEHIAPALAQGAIPRLHGFVANASRHSHAELDEAEELDDGDPEELGHQLAALRRDLPAIRVLGGCCGTDLRHIASIASASRP